MGISYKVQQRENRYTKLTTIFFFLGNDQRNLLARKPVFSCQKITYFWLNVFKNIFSLKYYQCTYKAGPN
jgi:hypothetical protein